MQVDKEDDVFIKLVESRGDEEDKKTIAILQEFSVTILDVIKRQCADQLPGGKFWDPPQEVIDAAKYVGTNNMSGERTRGKEVCDN